MNNDQNPNPPHHTEPHQHVRAPFEWQKYLIAFLITATIFLSAVYFNNYFDNKRVENIKSIQDQISLDILSSETQFDLLKEATCKSVDDSVLSQELNTLASKLSYMEENDSTNTDLPQLKKYYSLLEIKDFLLMKQLGQRCPFKPVSILYFYSQKSDCPNCEKMAYVLTYLRQQYPEVRIYSFDYNLNLSAVDTMKKVYSLNDTELPAVIVGDNVYHGFISVDDMRKAVPELKSLDKKHAADAAAAAKEAAQQASSTQSTSQSSTSKNSTSNTNSTSTGSSN